VNTSILDVMHDKKLFGKWFGTNWRGANTWKVWESFLAGLFALPMTAEMLAAYQKFTGRDDSPTQQAGEAYLIKGRRAGGSLISAFAATYLACFRDYSQILAPGEVGVAMIIASDKRQARVILGYINGFFDEIPILSRMVAHRTKESITLVNGIRIEVHTASFRSVRGYTVVFCALDELAFFSTEGSANPDVEIVNALRPAMATVPGALLLGISSPYAKRGVLWQMFREHFGKANAPVLVWKADSRSMNPKLNPMTVKLAYLRDSASASAEYGAQFRSDIETFLSVEIIERSVRTGRVELPPLAGVSYYAFVDPSGGVSDSMVLAIAHEDKGYAVLDCIVEAAAPFVPETVTKQFCAMLKRYRLSEVFGDRYSAEWCAQTFDKFGVHYRPSEKSRSEIYLEFLPAVMSDRVELLDNRRLVNQLAGLERVTGRGRDVIDHQPGGHDDVANAAAGALVLAADASSVLGAVEALKMIASGAVQLDGMARYNAPPDPNSPAPSTETRVCSQCQGTMRPQAERRDTFTCVSCGHCETISSVIAVSPSRTEYFAASAEPRRLKGFGRFGE
jgi:hypothetical protein